MNRAIGEFIRGARLKANLTLHEVADLIHVTEIQLSRYEEGIQGCPAKLIATLSKIYGIPEGETIEFLNELSLKHQKN